jgi:AcrR family transcriptional regulator
MDAQPISPTTAVRGRSTRDRPAKPPLSADAIIDAALAVCREETLEAVTMRRVAAELDTGAASLYVYVRNREELLGAMFGRVIGMVPVVTPDPARWREQIYDLLRALREGLEGHPGLAGALSGEPPTGANAMGGLENLLGLLLAGGIAAQDAAWACDILGLIVTATAAEADVRRAAGHTAGAYRDDTVAQIGAAFAGLPPERYPLIVAHASELVAGNVGDRFRFAIETFLDGLAARSARG